MENIYVRVGQQIKLLRKKRGLTQQALAESASISEAFLSFLESGKKKGSLDTYSKIAEVLNVNIDMLFKGAQTAKKVSAYNPPRSFQKITANEKSAIYESIKTLRKLLKGSRS